MFLVFFSSIYRQNKIKYFILIIICIDIFSILLFCGTIITQHFSFVMHYNINSSLFPVNCEKIYLCTLNNEYDEIYKTYYL